MTRNGKRNRQPLMVAGCAHETTKADEFRRRQLGLTPKQRATLDLRGLRVLASDRLDRPRRGNALDTDDHGADAPMRGVDYYAIFAIEVHRTDG